MLVAALLLLSTASPLRVGEEVLVRHEGFFLGAELLAMTANTARVKLLYDEPEIAEVALEDVGSMKLAGRKQPGFEGPWVLFHAYGNFWFPARVLSASETSITVADADGGPPTSVRHEEVYYPPNRWLSDLARQGERSEELADIKISGLPLGAGELVEVGQYVIAEQFGVWTEGRVLAVHRGQYKVSFPVGDPLEVPVSRAAPVPTAEEGFQVEVGEIVFARLDEISSWVAGRVDRIEGNNLTVTVGSGETLYLTPGTYLPQAP
jgi:hypothetical protein